MAIQIPNLGNGDGETGDNELIIRQKYNSNFSDQSNAASRLVGTATNNVMQVGAFGLGGAGRRFDDLPSETLADYSVNGFYRHGSSSLQAPLYSTSGDSSVTTAWGTTYFGQIHLSSSKSGRMSFRYVENGVPQSWREVYHTANTTIESSTNYLKVASPILRLQHNSFEEEHEAKKMDIAVENPSVGVYKITGTTGLRDDGTWYFSPPKDEHNNVLCMVEVSEKDGVITVNTYKKRFDFETVSIVADYEQPIDNPEGAIVMLRFNDLPAEPMPQE